MDEISTSQLNRIRQKSSWFCGTTHSPSDIENIKKNIGEFAFYAYIMHDKDEGKGLHIHFVGQVNGSRTIKSICEMLECDYQDVQVAKRSRGSIRYLIHADNKEKYQYSLDDVKTNNADRLKFYFSSFNPSITDISSDLRNLKRGIISYDEFVEKYSQEFSSLPFYQKVKTLEVIDKMSVK